MWGGVVKHWQVKKGEGSDKIPEIDAPVGDERVYVTVNVGKL